MDVAAARAELERLVAMERAEAPSPVAPKPPPPVLAAKQSAARVVGATICPLPPDPRQPDDWVQGDGTWLRDKFSRVKWLAAANLRPLCGLGLTRGAVRAGMGGVVAMAPGAVQDPVALLLHLARQVQAGKLADPRRRSGYFAHAGWGNAALRLANVHADC